MKLPEPASALIAVARRRLTVARLICCVVVAVGVAAALGSGVVAAARGWLWPWAEPAVAAGSGVIVAGAVIAAVLRRPSSAAAALTADRELDGRDRLSTALELTSRERQLTEVERWQVRSTGAWAEARSDETMVSLVPPRPIVALAGLAVVGTLILVLVPARSDSALATRQAMRGLIDREAAALEEVAEAVPPDLAEETRRLVEELGSTSDVGDALRLLGEARQNLVTGLDPSALARRTALAGLSRHLERSPIGARNSPVAQLRSLSEELTEAGPAALAAAAQELTARAEDFAGVDPDVATRLSEAAAALETLAGVPESSAVADATREALARLADALDRSVARAAADGARSDLAAQIRAAQQRLAEATGSAVSRGEGQGQREAQGQGPGGGQGSGGGGGGRGAGGSSGAGPSTGGTGAGSVSPGSGDADPFASPERAQVFDPVTAGLGEEVRVRIEGGRPGEVEGTLGGDGVENLPLTPYSDRYVEYAREALDGLERISVPGRLQDLVRDYFTLLEP